MTRRIAMWSGPRNISTALMRSFGNRADTAVCDEPFYAHYLLHHGRNHPGRDEILRHHETDWRKVATFLTGPPPDGKAIFYQKHMAHHLLPEIDLDRIGSLTHCFLIREPAAMLLSLSRVLPDVTLADTGLPQQLALYESVVREQGRPPVVIDARDVLNAPRPMLSALCDALAIDFDPAMLRWPPGRRATDGTWARHWYASVERSTGFGPPPPPVQSTPGVAAALLRECNEIHARLFAARLAVRRSSP